MSDALRFFLAQFTAPLITIALAEEMDGLQYVLGLYAVLALVGTLLAILSSRKLDLT